MSNSAKRQIVTLSDISERTGFSRSAVSLALRNHPSLPAPTREKIQKTAEAMGYRPNPLISALMSQVRDKRKKTRERIAIINRFRTPIKNNLSRETFYSILYTAIVEQATRQGFDVEEFHFDPKAPLSDRRLNDILIARGIHGILFFPGNNISADADYPTLDWDHFAVVLIGFNTRHIELHQVASHYSYNMDLALRHVAASGLTPIGLALSHHNNVTTDFGWTARFLLFQSTLPQRQRIPPLRLSTPDAHKEEFIKWFEKYRPRVILICEMTIEKWLTQAGYRIPEDVCLISLTMREKTHTLAGIDPCTHEVGRAATKLLVTLLQSNQLGLPEFPQMTFIKGLWAAGMSFPEVTVTTDSRHQAISVNAHTIPVASAK